SEIIFFIVFLTSFVQSQEAKFVRGTVNDIKSKNPAGKVNLIIHNEDSTTVYKAATNNKGEFSFKDVAYGEYDLVVNDRVYNEIVIPFELTEVHKEKGYTFDNFDISRKVAWMFDWGDYNGTEHYWSHITAKVVMVIYFICLVLILFYAILQLSLAVAYVKNKKEKKNIMPIYDPENAPMVTVQIPMYNEFYVADRIIEKVAEFDYPTDKLQIQVLDDSTDETKEVIAKKVAEVAARGINIQHIHRMDRTGYKAGALDDAMDQVQGEFIAIFDADFVPKRDFLQKTMPHFQDEKIGVVQTRWGHINKDYSLLTQLQAFGLNGHFAIEQGGRTASGHFINFNGTGGIWRKTCIEDAGGWEHDTLTEDLDLSYRAQLKGWKFQYCEDVISPAELPITMSALKSQQHRWMKGGAECFIKMRKRIINTKGIRFGDRVHALSHLFNSSVFVFILMISLISLPVLHIKDSFSDMNFILQYGTIFIVSTLFLMYYYWQSYRDKTTSVVASFFKFCGRFLIFLTVSMGLALNNTVAVIEGYLGIKSSFVRTPKFNVNVKGEFKGNRYNKKSLSLINIFEGLLMILFTYTAINRTIYGDLGMVPFHLMLAYGYGLVFFHSLKELRTANVK
ncbi:MAG TPA: glycosyltransferase, partial [Flavobacteriales bacterium]|nr:glycosyltransferase [Flavobacteriales bacterium]